MSDTETASFSPLIENDSPSQEVGIFAVVEGTRNIRGLLLPFNELSRPNHSNNAPVMFSAEGIKLPRDPSVITLNTEHDRFNPIGRAVSLSVSERGIEAEFAIADTDEGDAYLANPLRKLSAEVAGMVRDAADATRASFARLTGAAVCAEGAFASAGLYSLAPDQPEEERVMTREELEAELAEIKAELAAHQEALPDAPASEDETPEATPAEETKEKEEDTVSSENEAGVVPGTLLASEAAVVTERPVDLNAVFSAINVVRNSTTSQASDSENMLAALADIKAEATGGLTTAASGVIQPAWVGALWQGRKYQQKYVDLANHQFGGISLAGRKGYKLNQGTALVAEVANAAQKVELPTGTATTSVFGSSLRKFGYAADVAQEWFALEGGEDVIRAFFEGVVEDYAKKVDDAALKDIFLAASKTTTALDRRIAPGTYPTQYAGAMGMLIQGIEAIQDANDTPSFAIVNPAAWSQLIYTPKDLVPEFVSFNVGVGTGQASTSGVTVVKAPASYFTGLSASAPQIIVGAKNAIEFREQGTTPIELDALNIAKFGVDRSVVGFLETFVVRPESLALIGTV